MWKLLLAAAVLYFAYRWMVGRMRMPPTMPRAEAAKLLGLTPGAGTEDILDAHRRLIAKVHPDAGGNAELAARINRARDVMLER